MQNKHDGSVSNVTTSMIPKKGIQNQEFVLEPALKMFLIPGAARSVKFSKQKKAYLNELMNKFFTSTGSTGFCMRTNFRHT